MSLHENVTNALMLEGFPQQATWGKLSDAAIATVLAEIDAELERRIGDAGEIEDMDEYRSGAVGALVTFQAYIRSLGEGGDDAGAE